MGRGGAEDSGIQQTVTGMWLALFSRLMRSNPAPPAASPLRHTDLVMFAGASLLAIAFLFAGAAIKWPLDDFAEYWAAGRLNLAGGNPYDPAAMLHEQRGIGWSLPSAVMMYNPPWTLPLVTLFAVLPFQVARSVWLPIQLLLTLWCATRLWVMYGGAPRHAVRAAALALLWMPTVVALRMGQLSPLILLGLVGFLWSLSRRRELAAGVFFGLTAVKPQLVALVWIVFLLWTAAERRWRVFSGAALSVGGAALTAFLMNPDAFPDYARLMTSHPPTLAFESPNIATVLRIAVGSASDWPQYVPTAIGAVLVAGLWWRRRQDWDWTHEMPWLVILSCLLTSYGGWPFDLVVLLIPILAEAARLVRVSATSGAAMGAGAFCLISSVALALHAAHVPQAAFLWIVPSVAFGLYLLGAVGGRALPYSRRS
jgi:hypothetical protein